jgi:ribonuclease III
MPNIDTLQQSLGILFSNPGLLQQALVHSSYVNENPAYTSSHNERLEFLGDAVLDFIVADRIYRDRPELDEGEMTRQRAALVRRETLAAIARKINLGDFLFMGKGEESGGGRSNNHNLAGALEAVIAAVYLDGGISATEQVLSRLYEGEWREIKSRGASDDYKSMLQEAIQARRQPPPAYRLVSEKGPDHDKTFTVDVYVGEKKLAGASGKSKKLAETEAARLALENLNKGFTL